MEAESFKILTKADALAWLSQHIHSWSSKSQKPLMIQDILNLELFPHIGLVEEKAYAKACFLAHMTRKVLWVNSARMPNDDRDAYPNKRVDSPGFLLANLFRTFFQVKIQSASRNSAHISFFHFFLHTHFTFHFQFIINLNLNL